METYIFLRKTGFPILTQDKPDSDSRLARHPKYAQTCCFMLQGWSKMVILTIRETIVISIMHKLYKIF